MPAIVQATPTKQMEMERAATAAESAQKSLEATQWAAEVAKHTLAIQATLLVLAVGATSYTIWDTSRIRLVHKSIYKETEKQFKKITQAYETATSDLHSQLEGWLKSTKKVTDISDEELRKAIFEATPFAKAMQASLFAEAMLASRHEDWHSARSLWSRVLRATPDEDKSVHAKFHLALALHELADRTSRSDGQVLYGQITKIYEELSTVQQDDLTASSNVWNNWGACLRMLAYFAHIPALKQKLLKEAYDKYQKATNLNPNSSTAWFNQGDCQCALAEFEEPYSTSMQNRLREALGE